MKDIFTLKIKKMEARMFVVVILIVFGFANSCEDSLLSEDPRTVVEENFFNTADEFESATNAIYASLQNNTIIGNYIAILDNHTEWGFGRGSRAVFNDFQGLSSVWINGVGQNWEMFYESIRNANIVIRNAKEKDLTEQNRINSLVAEAKFLRAFNYFQLVLNWAGVPIRTEDNMEELDVPRSSVDEVYELIVSDLQEAEEILPEEQNQTGRATKFAAKTMLADVFLHLEMYTEARDKAKEVIDSGKFSLVPVETRDDISHDIFGPDVDNISEEIFFIKLIRQQGFGNFMPFVLNHPSTGLFNFGGVFAHFSNATLPFYKNWSDDDLRKGLWDMINFGLGDSTLVSRKFIDQNAATATDAGNDIPIYRFAEVLLIFAEAATRVAGEPTSQAVEALNKVHRRAYGFNPDTPSQIDFEANNFDENSFVDQVIEERGFEFIFEGKRWFTLKRTNKARELVRKNRGKEIADRHFLWPIPSSEIDFNDSISDSDQNPGY